MSYNIRGTLGLGSAIIRTSSIFKYDHSNKSYDYNFFNMNKKIFVIQASLQ